MTTPDKVCPTCGRDLRCVYTGAHVYLATTRKIHSADLFACFDCLTFHVYGMNRTPLIAWRKDLVTGERVEVPSKPNVVMLGDVRVVPYGRGSAFARVAAGDVYPLPAALHYMWSQLVVVQEYRCLDCGRDYETETTNREEEKR